MEQGLGRVDQETARIVVKYLARYTRKTAFSNSRLVSYKNDEVRFSFKNRSTGKRDVARLPADVFLSRFLRHVLPRRFVRIRYYGLLAHPVKRALISKARMLLGVDRQTMAQDDLLKTWRGLYLALTNDDPHAPTASAAASSRSPSCPPCDRLATPSALVRHDHELPSNHLRNMDATRMAECLHLQPACADRPHYSGQAL